MKKILPVVFGIIVLVLDQWSKLIVRNHMTHGETYPVLQNIFHITYIENDGVAFGLFAGRAIAFVCVSVIILIALFLFLRKEAAKSYLMAYGLALVYAGALGNIIDRGMKASVTDMFDFRIWPVFNVADIAICIGFGLIAVYFIFFMKEEDVHGA